MSRRQQLIAYALEYLTANLDHVGEMYEEDAEHGGEPDLAPLPTADELTALVAELRREARPAREVTVSHVLTDEEGFRVKEGHTLQDVLDEGGSFIDGCMEPPVAVFRADDGRWLVATVECCVEPVAPGYLRDRLAERIEDVETYGDDVADDPEAELVFLRAELAKLPPAEEGA